MHAGGSDIRSREHNLTSAPPARTPMQPFSKSRLSDQANELTSSTFSLQTAALWAPCRCEFILHVAGLSLMIATVILCWVYWPLSFFSCGHFSQKAAVLDAACYCNCIPLLPGILCVFSLGLLFGLRSPTLCLCSAALLEPLPLTWFASLLALFCLSLVEPSPSHPCQEAPCASFVAPAFQGVVLQQVLDRTSLSAHLQLVP